MAKIYVAHNFEARDWLREEIKPVLEAAGHTLTSRWIENGVDGCAWKPKEDAIADVEDVEAASTFILFAAQFGERPGKGKYFELGYAVRAGKTVIVIGMTPDCVFFHLPTVRWVLSLEEAMKFIH